MSTTTTTTALGTSNVRGSSSKTRNLPARTSRNARSNLRQNSLLSIPTSVQGQAAPPAEVERERESHGFYPAITHFTDAITALPRDFRRHTSLLKEVDAKAWALEENVQKLLQQCLHERQTRPDISTANTVPPSVTSFAGDILNANASTTGSVVANVLDTASQYSTASGDQDVLRRRRLYADLRTNLMHLIMPLDEKNHVINNANDELSRHIRRQDEIWPHIAEEISEETRLGSLRHWALTDLNPTKKAQAAANRSREAAAADNEVAERSERRREAMALAKKQKTALQLDSDAEIRKVSRKGISAKKAQDMEEAMLANTSYTSIVGVPNVMGKYSAARVANRKINEAIKNLGKEPAASTRAVPMSRENSQQEKEPSKKRKAPTSAPTAARKRYFGSNSTEPAANFNLRLNATAQESPKLGQSPLAATFAKEAYKRSPALSQAKPTNGRNRQNSAQSVETRPASAASRRNGVTATGSELGRIATATGKTASEVRQTMKETISSKGEKLLEEDIPDSVDNRIRGGILLERTGSKSSQLRREAQETISGRRTASPRIGALDTAKAEKNSRAKAKISTPVLGSFADAETEESATEATSFTENGNDPNKGKRPARPRIKDHHGLHDSLSPKGLPTKRMHKKNGSYSLAAVINARKEAQDDDTPAPSTERKAASSRNNSRSTKNNSTTDPSRDGRNASSTPKIGGPATELVDEPDSLPLDQPASRRQSQNPKQTYSQSSSHYNVQPPAMTAASPVLKGEDTPLLGSPGPEEEEDEADEADEDDPNETRYCYCNGVSYGEMVACDNDNCAREWFHLECTGLRSLPPAKSKWFCDECKATMVR